MDISYYVSYVYECATEIYKYTDSCEIEVSNPQISATDLYINIYDRGKYNGYYYGESVEITGLTSYSQVIYAASSPDLQVYESWDGEYELRPAKAGNYSVVFVADGRVFTCNVHVVKLYFERNNKSVGDSFSDKISKKWVAGYTMLALYKGESATLKLKGMTAGTPVVWTSSDTSVATVNSKGKVVAKGVGYSTITATVDIV